MSSIQRRDGTAAEGARAIPTSNPKENPMPQPTCDLCGKRVAPEDRVTAPSKLDNTGRVEQPAESWHTECKALDQDDLSEAMSEEYPEHAPFWQPH